MKVVNFDKKFKTLRGEKIEENDKELVMKEVVGDMLMFDRKSGSAVRQMKLAQDIFVAKGEFKLEDADFELVQTVLTRTEMTVMVKAQIQESLDDAKEVTNGTV